MAGDSGDTLLLKVQMSYGGAFSWTGNAGNVGLWPFIQSWWN